MQRATFRNRRAVQLENESIRVTVTEEGGHVAEILHKATGVNPLWAPPWPSIEPSAYDAARHPQYGPDIDAPLLAGILGHNLCLDTFGGPSPEEAAAGMPVHGEAGIAPFRISGGEREITMTVSAPIAELAFERRIRLASDQRVVLFAETVENLSSSDRPIAWTQHVTLGPPFLERGATRFRASATRSRVGDASFNGGKGNLVPDAEFDWPLCPTRDGRVTDLRVFTNEPVSGGFTTHLMDPASQHAWFLAWSPETKVLFGYVWQQADFPWLARWEENHLRTQAPWNGAALTCGLEFGASPMAESRRQMITRGSLFGVPGFRWAPARSRLEAVYAAFVTTADRIPESVAWDGSDQIQFVA